MELVTLRDLFNELVRDLYCIELHLVRILPKVAERIASEELKSTVEQHIAETERQVGRLEEIARVSRASVNGHTSLGVQGMSTEVLALLASTGEPDVIDLALASALRRIEHYEMSSYCNARELAEVCASREVVQLIDESLQEEQQAEQSLTILLEEILDSQSIAEISGAKQPGDRQQSL